MANLPLFDRLKADNTDIWTAYTCHEFVAGLQSGDLPKEAFRYYLKQDYLFLIHFARAYALAVYKSQSLADMRAAAAVMDGLLNVEMEMHKSYCREWGIDPDDLEKIEEAPENMAYTRYVLERGMAGDVLDLMVALCPCVIGYGEIGARLMNSTETRKEGNPYLPWIEMYASEDYSDVVTAAKNQLDELSGRLMTEERFPQLSKTFGAATRLEAGFWQMGLNIL